MSDNFTETENSQRPQSELKKNSKWLWELKNNHKQNREKQNNQSDARRLPRKWLHTETKRTFNEMLSNFRVTSKRYKNSDRDTKLLQNVAEWPRRDGKQAETDHN